MMSDFEIRLIEEKLDLHEKMVKLWKFLESDKINNIDKHEKKLLKLQYKAMKNYYGVLNHRCYFHANGKWPEPCDAEC